jgi:hypothetical protein
MNKLASIMTVVLFSLAGTAHAATLDVTLGNLSSDISYSDTGGPINPNINLATALLGGSLVLNSNSAVTIGSIPNIQAQPGGSLFGGTYLAVYGVPITGVSTFTLNAGQNTFAFTWGTVDNYNSLLIKDSRGTSYNITGTNVLAAILGSSPGNTQSDVRFKDNFGTIVSAQLSSTQNSFEAANFSEASSTPLPASLPLFGMALLGFAVFAAARRRRAVKA